MNAERAIMESDKHIDNMESSMPNLEELDQAFLDGQIANAKATQAVALAILELAEKKEKS